MNVTKKHLSQIMDEARKLYVELPGPVYLDGDIDASRNLSEGERLALCYLKSCLLTLNINSVLCDGWENKFSINIQSESSEPAVD